MRKVVLAILIVAIIAGVLVLVSKRVSDKSEAFPVVTSFYPVYFLANEIGGGKISVMNITPAGVEPHDYELTPQNMVQIQNSKLLIMNGNMEPWEEKIRSYLKEKKVKIVTVDEKMATDPHSWLSPRLFKFDAQKVRLALQEIDPANSEQYRRKELELVEKLDKLDEAYKTGLSNCERRSFVTSHAAFSYLAQEYNLEQIAIEGVTSEEEPSLAKLAEVADFSRKNNIKYIFFESLVSPKFAETIAEEVGAQTLVLDPIEGVRSEEMANGSNYLTLMNKNLQNLRKALQCK